MATTSAPIEPVRHFVRCAALALLAAVVLTAAGYYPTRSVAGPAGVPAMALGIGIALLGAWLGSLPPLFFVHRPLHEFPTGILAGLLVRFVATLGVALGIWALDIVAGAAFLIWVGMGQIVILAVDTIGMIRLARSLSGGAS